ncbi:uncharacterized protein V1513DRAFT_444784 [Lipomyces chichibuensis]|uniref:uncharacterized protein n=1 Tax=Lipomyces chichibuensis TaxID=1546026 RepID=UPI0033431F4E
MVRYSLSLGVLVVSLTLSCVSGAPALFYPVVNVDGGSSAVETVPVTEEGYFTIPTSTLGGGAVYTSCNAFSIETVVHTTTVTVDQQSTITKIIGIDSVSTDYQTLTVTEYYTIRPTAESNASVTSGHQNSITQTVEYTSPHTEYKTLTVTKYPTISPSRTTTAYVTVTPSHSADKTTTVTITAAPITITETIGLTTLQFEQVTLTNTQYVTVAPEQTISKSLTTVVATPTRSDGYKTVYVTHYSYLSPTTVTIVRTVNPAEVSSTAIAAQLSESRSSFVLSMPISSEPLSAQTASPSSSSLAAAAAAASDAPSETSSASRSNSVTVTVTPSSSISSSAESVTVTVTERVPFLSSPEPVTVTVTEAVSSSSGVAIAVKPSSTPVTAVTISSEVDSTITVTQPGETYTLIIDRTAIVTDSYTTYVTEYRALSPLVSTTFSSSLIEATPSPSSPSSSSGDGTGSTVLSLNVPTLTPPWANTTITTTIPATSTYYPSTDTITQFKTVHNGTFI